MPEGITIDATDEQLAGLKYNSDGLITAIAQDVENGDILMLAWMNEESFKMTLAEGRMVYWSRSRQELWRKGDTSGDRQFVKEAYYDCDADDYYHDYYYYDYYYDYYDHDHHDSH